MKDQIPNKVSFLALMLLISACDLQPSNNSEQPTSPELIEINEIVPGTMFATFDPKQGYEKMLTAAKAACGTEAICKVIIFPPGTVLPSQFPMTDREVSLEIGNYTLNRNSGADELLVPCDKVAGAPEGACIADE